MLERLKEEVKKSQYPSSTYTSLEDLGSQVEQAFTALLDRLFPEGNITELERERIGQRSFMRQLCQNYIRDDNNYKALDDWMGDWEQHQLVVTGASGLGKSALIANWTNGKLNDPNRNYNIIYHFTGNGGSQSGHEHIMKVLADEIKDVYGWTNEKEGIGMAQTAEIRMNTKDGVQSAGFSSENNKNAGEKELDNLFVKVASEGDEPLLIILDAVNQIVDRDNAKLLNWLPVSPRNIKILFSTLEDDRTMEVFRNRRYPVLTLHPLSEDNRRRLANDYLHLYGKKLTDAQVTRIVTDSQCENTMVLKTLLDELINFGVYEKLDSRIDYYLSRDTIEDFYQALLASYESDYGMDFVKHVLSLISVSKNGLSEDEILSLTQARPYLWSQFHCAILSHMTVRNGLIGFSHTYIQNAVDSRYINNDKPNELQCREEIVHSMVNADSSRSQIEIPFQLFRMQAYERLHDFLLNADVFNVLYDENEYELGDYWRSLTANGYKLSEYLPFIKEAGLKICEHLTLFCINTMADYETAKSVSGLFLAKAKSEGAETTEYAKALVLKGILLYQIGDYQKALEYYQKALSIRKKLYDVNHHILVSSYISIGGVCNVQGVYPKAIEYYNKALSILEMKLTTNHRTTAILYNNMGLVYHNLGDYSKALEYYRKSLSISKKVLGENHPDTATSYNNIGGVYNDQGNFPKALEYYEKALIIRVEVFGANHPDIAMSFNNIGGVYYNLCDYPKALEYYEKAHSICEKVFGENHPNTASSYNNMGLVYQNQGDHVKALEYHHKALSICEKIFGENHPLIATIYDNIGLVYTAQINYSKALKFFQKALFVYNNVFYVDHPFIATSYNNIGVVYLNQGDYPKALEYGRKALEIRKKVLGINHIGTAQTNDLISGICFRQNDFQHSLEYELKALSIYEKVLGSNHWGTVKIFNNVSRIYEHLGNYSKAIEYALKALPIMEKQLGSNHSKIADAYNHIGGINHRMGDYSKSLEYTLKALSIQEKKLGTDHPKTAFLMRAVGVNYRKLNDPEMSLRYTKKSLEAYIRIYGEEHLQVAATHNSVGLAYRMKDMLEEALVHFRKALDIRKKLLPPNHKDIQKSLECIRETEELMHMK
jgi:preprotein translocase subunit SecA/nephrocystin-3